jgi:hypothetical protein
MFSSARIATEDMAILQRNVRRNLTRLMNPSGGQMKGEPISPPPYSLPLAGGLTGNKNVIS